jgi:hypothetical protein
MVRESTTHRVVVTAMSSGARRCGNDVVPSGAAGCAQAGTGRSEFVDAPGSGSLGGRELPVVRAPWCKRAAVVTTGVPGHAR